MVCSGYSAFSKMEDCYSDSRGFERVGYLTFFDMKILFNSMLPVVREKIDAESFYVPVCVWGMKMPILYIKHVSSKIGQKFSHVQRATRSACLRAALSSTIKRTF